MSHLRYGHSEGHTDLCYSNDFEYIITCGSEGDVRIWKGIDDADQIDTCVGEQAWAVCQKVPIEVAISMEIYIMKQGKTLYVGTDTNIVQAYTFPELEVDGIITRFTAPPTHIDVSPDGKKLVASSCDMNIHVVDIESMECKKLIGHRAPVLSVSIDPKLEFVASSGCDSTVRIWSLNSFTTVKEWNGVAPKVNSFEVSPTLCRLQFEPRSGNSLAVPEGDSVKLYKRDVWSLLQTLCTGSSNEVLSVVKFSPCGKMLAGGCASGNIYIWDLLSSSIIDRYMNSGPTICSISWCASASFAFVNYAGQLGSFQMHSSIEKEGIADNEIDAGDIPLAEPEFDDDEDEDDENVISLRKIKAETGFGEDGEYHATMPSDEGDDKESIAESLPAAVSTVISELQSPFQPSSTPEHLQQRFMVWNEIGIVRQFNMEDMNDVDIEFHDSSHHYGIRMNNILGYTMAALTPNHIVLASPKINDVPSKVVCILLNSWDGQKEWDITLGSDEEVQLVTGGDSWIAVGTDTPTVRLFSSDGTQTDLLSLPGPLLSMAGRGPRLAIVFHSGIGSHGDQFLSVAEVKITLRRRLALMTDILPVSVSKGSGLRWVGYTDEGSLATLDTQGTLRILYKKIWRPVCYLDKQCKSEFDHYFIVGVSEIYQNVRCILCKGAFYPPIVPKPLVTEIKWQLPICELDSDKSLLEEELLRSAITLPHINAQDEINGLSRNKIEKSISVVIMKLFALAAKSGLDSRALTLCESMASVDVIKLAAKYAAKLGKHNLADKVSDIANKIATASENSYKPIEEEECEEDVQAQEEVQNKNYSQDLFEENEQKKDNLIFKMMKKNEKASPKPFKVRMNYNPFKKPKDLNTALTKIDEDDTSKVTFIEWYNTNKSRLQTEFPLLKESELAMAGMKQYRLECQVSSSNGSSTIKDDDSSILENSSPLRSTGGESKKRKISPTISESKKKIPIGTASSKLKNFTFCKK